MELQENKNEADKVILSNDTSEFTKMAAMKRVEGVDLSELEEKYLLPHFLMLLVGKPGSGKTTMIKHLIMDKEFYRGKFDEIYIVSPSHSKIGLPISNENSTSEFDLMWIYKRLDKQNQREQRVLEELVVSRNKNPGDETIEEKDPFTIMKAVTMDRAGMDSLTHVGMELATNSRDIARYSGLTSRGNDDYLEYKLETGGLRHNVPLGKTRAGSSLRAETNLAMAYTEVENNLGENQDQKRKRTEKRVMKRSIAGNPTFVGLKSSNTETGNFYSEFISKVSNLDKKILTMLDPDEIKESRLNILLVLDDVIGPIKAIQNDPYLAQLFFNRRHLVANGVVSIILVTEKYTMIPARIRSNASWLILFRLNPLDFDNVFNDAFTGSAKRFKELLNFVYGDEDENLQELSDERKNKNFDNLGIWIETDTYFSNFRTLGEKEARREPKYELEENARKEQEEEKEARKEPEIEIKDR